ncbi:MAG TPA: VCBS repeat-containing protein [Acidobacteriaceae bacterium]|nr:VCBS repeat-containing protein [Acidobacteriaceae bacterium]
MSKLLALAAMLFFSLAGFSQSASFSSHNAYTLNAKYIRVIGDLNNDGYQDLVIFTDPAAANPSFSVLLSNGDGTYKAPITYTLPAGSGVTTPVLADFNGDGKLDLVVESANASGFTVYLGNGDGTFRAPVAHSVTEPLPIVAALAAADVNGDNKTDLLVETTNEPEDNYDLQAFFSNGDGTFTAGPVIYNITGGELLTGDFNGDGKTDIAPISATRGGTQLQIWLGDGTGNFKMSYSDGSLENFDFVAADLNGDGISDLVGTANNYCIQCTNPEEPYFTVYYGHSDGTVQRTQVPITGGCPMDYPVVADFNGDGIPDIAFGGLDCQSTQPNSMSILFGKGNGQFGSQENSLYTFAAPAGGYSYYAYPAYGLRGNRDTKADLVVSQQNFALTTNRPFTSNHIITLLNTTSGNFPTCNAPNAAVGITVCSPGSSAASPVNFSIGASGDTAMRKVEVWADGKKQAEQFAGAFTDYAFFNNSFPLAAGSHKITVFAVGWDNSLQSKSFTLNVSGSSSCSLPASAGVHVCSPANGSTVSSPVNVQAAGKVTGTLAHMELWVDGLKKYTSATSTLKTTLTLAARSHRFAVLAINTAGQKWETTVYATVQ